MKKLLLFTLGLFFASAASEALAQHSQYLCNGAVKHCIFNKKDGYVFNQQSKSGSFIQGDTAEVTIVVYKNMDYRISACAPEVEELQGQMKFKIVEEIKEAEWQTNTVTQTVTEYDDNGNAVDKEVTKEVKKRVYVKKKVVRYDGYKDEEENIFEFISDKTRKLTIQVYIPEVGGEGGELAADDVVCIGLLIEHRPAPKNFGKFK
ncbi:hypothetical protein [Parvicella tangerina]|uniref:Uncharacterized protein n=1 Tax=Parvicella tangerina TaxID=2829795 RepID=A0A916JNI7_9FLAO|nr:hypothetical protein [Parvicella tangerina]CAG5082177.1 hypothetical protein CRYO30217_01828 [Parvicella tangerina]